MKPHSLAVSLLIACLPSLGSAAVPGAVFAPAAVGAENIPAAGPETLASGSVAAFSRLSEFKPDFHITRLEARRAEVRPAATIAAAQKYIRLSGFVSISGSQYIPPGSAFAWVNVSGYANLQDDGGHYLGQVLVSDYTSCTVSGISVSCWARPRAEVSIYDGGRYLGTVHVEGSFFLSGFHNGGWVNLNGSGYVNGQGYIEDPAPPQRP